MMLYCFRTNKLTLQKFVLCGAFFNFHVRFLSSIFYHSSSNGWFTILWFEAICTAVEMFSCHEVLTVSRSASSSTSKLPSYICIMKSKYSHRKDIYDHLNSQSRNNQFVAQCSQLLSSIKQNLVAMARLITLVSLISATYKIRQLSFQAYKATNTRRLIDVGNAQSYDPCLFWQVLRAQGRFKRHACVIYEVAQCCY